MSRGEDTGVLSRKVASSTLCDASSFFGINKMGEGMTPSHSCLYTISRDDFGEFMQMFIFWLQLGLKEVPRGSGTEKNLKS